MEKYICKKVDCREKEGGEKVKVKKKKKIEKVESDVGNMEAAVTSKSSKI